MFKNNLKIAWRNFVKDRLFSLLTLTGLATGLASVLFIYLWVNDEWSMDRFHANDPRLYQVMSNIKLTDGIHTQDNTPGLLASTLVADLPEVEMATAIKKGYGPGVVSNENKHLKVSYQFVDSHFFQVFSYPLVAGDKKNPLPGNHSVLLSDELALKLFGGIQNGIGQTVLWQDEKEPYIISGIFKKPPSSSTAIFDLLFNFQLAVEKDPEGMQQWENSNAQTYFVVRKGTDIDRLSKKLYGYLQTKSSYSPLSLWLAKYSDGYLHNKFENGRPTGGRIEYVRLFSLIALFILAIACINFMNLSTAKAARRAKEIGIKKVAGASRATLILQYIGESLLMAFLSLILAVVIVILLLPEFNNITGKLLTIQWNAGFIATIVALAVCTGLIAGSYPAFYLSRFKPVTVLKGKLPPSLVELWVRKGLVVFQFTLSAVFIIAVLTIYKQMNLVQTINLGYTKDNIISFKKEGDLSKSFEPFMAELKTIPGVVSASSFDADMTGNSSGSTEKISWQGKKPGDTAYCIALDVDYELLDMLDIKMAAGRTFSRQFSTDSFAIILNQAAVAAMNMKSPIGKTVTVWGATYTIIGITGNFHFESLYEKVKPCFIRCRPGGSNIVAKIKAGSERSTLVSIGKLYRAYNPIFPFAFTFLDQDYQAMYAAEQKVAVLSRLFAGLAIVISCLGLFGLAAFTAEKRKKEIGIRKVIGASVGQVVLMLSTDFLRLVLLSVLIAFPISWWALNQWLSGFAYRVQMTATVFLMAGLSIIFITLLTISAQSIKAALANPVKALRSE